MSIVSAINNKTLNEKRLHGDLHADRFTAVVFDNPEDKITLSDWMKDFNSNNQFNNLPKLFQQNELFIGTNQLPFWADKKAIKAGAAFFAKHANAIMNMLGLLSLPYCYTAANGAMVLYLSERINNDTAKRLFDTASFVWDVMSPDAFEENGKGFAAILKVRLIHAAVRFYTLKSGKWDKQWGLPVNQEDMAGTNLAFSLIVIRGLRKFGYNVSYHDQQAYLHYWNVVGYLLSLDENLLPQTGKEAYQLESAIRERHFKASEQGISLTNALTTYFFKVNTGNHFSNLEIIQVMRYLLGNEIADMLGLTSGSLPNSKIGLLKFINFMNEFNIQDNNRLAYKRSYSQFMQHTVQN